MDFVEKYYVGFQKERYSRTDDQRMLGFATPIDNTAAYRKRKETVDGWRDKNIATIELENKPRYGFQIVDTVTRYRTNNKLFRVLDPAGFELEISAENLFHIIASCTIAKGTIADPMVWARGPSKNYLISSNSEEYKMYLQPKKSANHLPGAWMKHKTGNVFYRYEGRFSYIILGYDLDRNDGLGGRWYYHNRAPDFSKVETHVKFTVNRKNDKTATVYTEWSLDEDGNLKQKPATIHIRKSYFKDLVELDDKDPKAPEYDLPVGKIIDHAHVTSAMGEYWSNRFMIFNNKEDAMAEEFDVERLNTALTPIEKNNSYYGSEYYGKVSYHIRDIR